MIPAILKQRLFPRPPPVGTDRPLLGAEELATLRRRVTALSHEGRPLPRDGRMEAGELPAPRPGSGSDHEESRPWSSGDELRHVNWRLTARTGELHVKIYRQERREGLFLVVDRRAAMRFATRGRLKAAQAAAAAAALLFATMGRGESSGGVLLEPGPRWFEERQGESGGMPLALAAASPAPALATPAEPSLAGLLDELGSMLRPGLRVVILSDLADLEERCRGPLMALAARHRVEAVEITDPADEHLPDAGLVRLEDGSGTARLVDTADPRVRRAWQAAAEAERERRHRLLHQCGIPRFLLSTTDSAPERVLPLR